MKNKKAPKRKAAAKRPPKKAAPKKASPDSKRINVFTRGFLKIPKQALLLRSHTLVVECSTEGDLRDGNGDILTFTSLDAANIAAGDHADQFGPGHDCMVKASQHR